MFSRSSFLLLTLLIGSQAFATPESTQLALALKQLEGVKMMRRAINAARPRDK
ncbi:hypothetical protein LCU15_000297 [Salmonella enterica]|nr:hypothetical protein [Salmonella enterica]